MLSSKPAANPGKADRHFGREREPCGQRAGASVPGVGVGAKENATQAGGPAR